MLENPPTRKWSGHEIARPARDRLTLTHRMHIFYRRNVFRSRLLGAGAVRGRGTRGARHHQPHAGAARRCKQRASACASRHSEHPAIARPAGSAPHAAAGHCPTTCRAGGPLGGRSASEARREPPCACPRCRMPAFVAFCPLQKGRAFTISSGWRIGAGASLARPQARPNHGPGPRRLTQQPRRRHFGARRACACLGSPEARSVSSCCRERMAASVLTQPAFPRAGVRW